MNDTLYGIPIVENKYLPNDTAALIAFHNQIKAHPEVVTMLVNRMNELTGITPDAFKTPADLKAERVQSDLEALPGFGAF